MARPPAQGRYERRFHAAARTARIATHTRCVRKTLFSRVLRRSSICSTRLMRSAGWSGDIGLLTLLVGVDGLVCPSSTQATRAKVETVRTDDFGYPGKRTALQHPFEGPVWTLTPTLRPDGCLLLRASFSHRPRGVVARQPRVRTRVLIGAVAIKHNAEDDHPDHDHHPDVQDQKTMAATRSARSSRNSIMETSHCELDHHFQPFLHPQVS